jgi:NitT/TauT family transport system ATP-binding protein
MDRGVAIALEGVHRTFRSEAGGEVPALAGIDLAVDAGDFVALLGPSGCGKSTLLRLVAGLDRPQRGHVELNPASAEGARSEGAARAKPDGAGPARAKAQVGMVFQDAHLLPWRDVRGNVELPLELLGVPAPERRTRAEAAIAQVGLGDAARRYPAELSGGMKMRASLARALVTEPRLLLLDEPFAALDELTRMALDDELRRLWRAAGLTVLFVTHSIAEAAYLAERVVVLSRRPARMVLDRHVALPAERTSELRADPAFARETGVLQDALRRGAALA